MLPSDAKIISVDDHVIEHPRVWLDRLPAKYATSPRPYTGRCMVALCKSFMAWWD